MVRRLAERQQDGSGNDHERQLRDGKRCHRRPPQHLPQRVRFARDPLAKALPWFESLPQPRPAAVDFGSHYREFVDHALVEAQLSAAFGATREVALD